MPEKIHRYPKSVFLVLILSACTTPQSKSRTFEDSSERNLVVCFGDSLTLGYGLSDGQSYPSLFQNRLNEKGFKLRVITEAANGRTTAQGLEQLPEVLEKHGAKNIRLFVLALAANDGLKQVPVEETRLNLEKMLQRLSDEKIPILLVGLRFSEAMHFGQNKFEGMFETFQEKFKTSLVPDLLKGIRLKPEFNQSDLIHPNPEGTKLMFETIWKGAEESL